MGRELGRGQYGVVYEVVDKATGEKFACKQIAKNRLKTQADVELIRKEVMIMARRRPLAALASHRSRSEGFFARLSRGLRDRAPHTFPPARPCHRSTPSSASRTASSSRRAQPPPPAPAPPSPAAAYLSPSHRAIAALNTLPPPRRQVTFEDAWHVYLVMELASGGELFDRIVSSVRQPARPSAPPPPPVASAGPPAGPGRATPPGGRVPTQPSQHPLRIRRESTPSRGPRPSSAGC